MNEREKDDREMKGIIIGAACAALAGVMAFTTYTGHAADPREESAYRLVKQTVADEPHVTKIENAGHLGNEWHFNVYATFPDNVDEPGPHLYGWYRVDVQTKEVTEILGKILKGE